MEGGVYGADAELLLSPHDLWTKWQGTHVTRDSKLR